jgi:hypothetical protein
MILVRIPKNIEIERLSLSNAQQQQDFTHAGLNLNSCFCFCFYIQVLLVQFLAGRTLVVVNHFSFSVVIRKIAKCRAKTHHSSSLSY